MTSGGPAEPARDRSWDNDLSRLYGRGVSAESWQDSGATGRRSASPQDPRAVSQDSEPQSPAGFGPERGYGHAGEMFGAGQYPAQQSGVPSTADRAFGDEPVDDYGRGLFGGPGADLFGSRMPSESVPDQGPSSISMPSISQPMSPLSDSMPSISQPMSRIPDPAEQSMPGSPVDAAPGAQGAGDAGETGSLVRPYARTRGRTRTEYDLAIETLVSTSERGRGNEASVPEHRSICGLCVEARSVAEVAAHMRLPLGVVRVLIGDMAGLGLVLIHESGMVVGDQPSLEFLERVLSGLRRL